MKELTEKYAKLKGTTILKSYMNDDGTITFILESGPKMTMSADLLRDAIAAMEDTHKLEAAIEEVKQNFNPETQAERKAKLKAEARAKKEAEKAAKETTK